MIVKEKAFIKSNSKLIAAGDDNEKSVAFYLRRAFKNHDKVFVFNDLKLAFDGETAQIDHLIVYPYGFLVLESKSIAGEVNVNEQGEWRRSYQGKWRGIPSPLKQADLQLAVLKELLRANDSKLLGKILGMQAGFGRREYGSICTVSNNAIIDRKNLPKEYDGRVVKADTSAEVAMAIMNLPKNGALGMITAFKDERAGFSKVELDAICAFLLEADQQARAQSPDNSDDIDALEPLNEANLEPNIPPASEAKPKNKKESALEAFETALCKACGKHDSLEFKGGRYGYYAHCAACDVNTKLSYLN